MGGLIKGLISLGDSIEAQNTETLKTAWKEYEDYTVAQKYELVLFSRQGKVYQKERRRITVAARDAGCRMTIAKSRKFDRAPAAYMEREK